MRVQPAPQSAALPVLPHWEEPPSDLPAAIAQVKSAIRARIAASGRSVAEVFAVVERQALSGIPDVRAGDSVWWHCDMVHSVAPVRDQQGWGNVMYIPAAPWCPRNERYAASVREAFRTGSSPGDFPAEHYERTWPDRFQPGDLNPAGRLGLGLDPAE